MKRAICAVLTTLFVSQVWAGFPTKTRLPAASTTERIIQYTEEHKGFGRPQWALLKAMDKEIFVIWNDPFSGRSATYVQAYYLSDKQWVLFLDELIDGVSSLTPKIASDSNTLVLYTKTNQEILVHSLQNLKPIGIGTTPCLE